MLLLLWVRVLLLLLLLLPRTWRVPAPLLVCQARLLRCAAPQLLLVVLPCVHVLLCRGPAAAVSVSPLQLFVGPVGGGAVRGRGRAATEEAPDRVHVSTNRLHVLLMLLL